MTAADLLLAPMPGRAPRN